MTDATLPPLPHRYRPGTARAAFAYRDFRIIWIGVFLSSVGTWMQTTLLGGYVDERFHSGVAVGLMVFALLGPTLLLSIPGGVLADKLPRRGFLIAMQSVLARRLRVNGHVETVAARELAPGDRILLASGERAPVDGMLEALTEAVRDKARPFFGICVGMQLMATRGKEHVTTDGFNWIEGDVEKIAPRDESLKIPHMGWNTLDQARDHPVLERLPLGPKGRHAYFVHSYHLKAVNDADVLARADYGGPVTAIVGKDTVIGTQFHPEKSQRFGLALIANFLKWKP